MIRRRTPESTLADARFTIEQTSGWIRHADAKSGILATALGVATGLLVGKLSDATLVVKAGTGWSWVVAFAGVAAGVAAIITGIMLVIALMARARSVPGANRYSWFDIARDNGAQLGGDAEAEAWAQVLNLSQIARAKFRFFNAAFRSFIVFIACAIVFIVFSVVGK